MNSEEAVKGCIPHISKEPKYKTQYMAPFLYVNSLYSKIILIQLIYPESDIKTNENFNHY
nr:MAG TPA: hypothetical protein [Caudoviricetes sp.]